MQPSLADAEHPAFHEGDQPIPGFRLVRRRGRGGFGEVWEAEASGEFRVALKFVPLSPRARAAELRSLEFVRGIHHPNLLASFGSWQVGNTLIIGMELADRSLWDRFIEVADQGLSGIPRTELLGYMADAAAGVDYLNDYRHTLDGRTGVGVQHRDLKPPNILLCGGGAKVADLGMARAMEGERAGHTGIWTFPFAAPEFFRGQTARQSDQYSLAATYCQLRCGRLPFDGNAASVTAGHLFGQPDLDALPEAERPILAKALAKEPDDRWPDCRSFVKALRELAEGEVPEEIHEPFEPDDIPRMYRSSTGSVPPQPSGLDGTDNDSSVSSWRVFDSTDSLEALLYTSEPPPPSPIDSVVTAILPTTRTDFEPPAVVRRPSARFGRSAAMVVAVALALAVTGVRSTPLRDHDPQSAPLPARIVPIPTVEGPMEPTSEPEPLPSLNLTAEVRPMPDPEPAPASETRPEAKPKPRPEPEPAPAPAAEEADLASTTTEEGPPPLSLATRTDLVPKPRVRRDLAPDLPTGNEATLPRLDPLPEAKKEAEEPTSSPIVAPARVVVADPDATRRAEAAFARGRGDLARGAFEQAVAQFDEVIRLRPGDASGFFHRALARHRASHYPEALADYSRAIRLRPGDASAFIARGQAHHDLGAFGRAVDDYTQAILLQPGNPSARYRRGLARYRASDYAGAVDDLSEVIRLNPKNSRAIEFRDNALAHIGGRSQSGTDLDRATMLKATLNRPTTKTATQSPAPGATQPRP